MQTGCEKNKEGTEHSTSGEKSKRDWEHLIDGSMGEKGPFYETVAVSCVRVCHVLSMTLCFFSSRSPPKWGMVLASRVLVILDV